MFLTQHLVLSIFHPILCSNLPAKQTNPLCFSHGTFCKRISGALTEPKHWSEEPQELFNLPKSNWRRRTRLLVKPENCWRTFIQERVYFGNCVFMFLCKTVLTNVFFSQLKRRTQSSGGVRLRTHCIRLWPGKSTLMWPKTPYCFWETVSRGFIKNSRHIQVIKSHHTSQFINRSSLRQSFLKY